MRSQKQETKQETKNMFWIETQLLNLFLFKCAIDGPDSDHKWHHPSPGIDPNMSNDVCLVS